VIAARARQQAAGLLPQPCGATPKCFIGRQHRGGAERASSTASRGPAVQLLKDGRVVGEATSDNYGDFKLDKLDEGFRQIRWFVGSRRTAPATRKVGP